MSHVHDPDIVKRLRRAQGHLDTVVKMLGGGREVPEVVQQLQAVEKALEKVKMLLIFDHIDHHLFETTGTQTPETRRSIESLKALTKYL
ncbi:metal-sensing transcriptional repressor [Bosea sp. BIWAKO-01]|uniref:metal-sensing transcriptional repressor n=1 Tax=Bosea sp. BIWAKO-01 TaxID=506668 RepID=UPI000852C39C|nr:metal-sensing transcriptional repressor [Bosea sp. BIWAKO-01]